MLHLHSRRDVDERAAAEDRAVERAEFVVAGRDDFAEPLPENLRVFLQALGRADEDHALIADGFLDVGVNRLAVELRFDAGEEFSFLLRNAEPLEGALHVLRHIVPRLAARLCARARGSSGFCRRSMFSRSLLAQWVGIGFASNTFERLLPEIAHPVGIFL